MRTLIDQVRQRYTHTANLKTRLREVEQALVVSNERLRHAEEKFTKALHFSPLLASLSTAADECFVDISDSFARFSGYSREEMIGRSWHELGLWGNIEDYTRIKGLITTQHHTRDQEIRWRSKHGGIYSIVLSAVEIMISDVPHIMVFAMDITDHKLAQKEKDHLENQLLQAQKIEAIGRLAGGLAHDFNNLLSIMLGYAEIGLEDPSIRDLPVHNTLTQIIKAGERVHNLTRQLLDFGRKQVLKREALNLNHIILDFQQMLSRLMGDTIEISTCLAEDPWSVLMDITQAEQILLNIAVNARDAMPQGGQLFIKTANVCAAESMPSCCRLVPGEYIELAVSDTGCGIDESTMQHIFEPFFTTKERGKGTGLGLSTVYGIVKQHGGEIYAESDPGRGATFKIFLPRCAEAV
jgi:two-component system, cell cycle sensor histidine kinase and response regulator CckA